MAGSIELKGITKKFNTSSNLVVALDNVNLKIESGSIYGIIGMSGAGKSTLVRCINLLEKPDKGQVIIGGDDIMTLSKKDLLKKRQNIGMIFQHFNLLLQKNIVDNVAFPLIASGVKKKEAKKKAYELIKTVGLEGKEKAYPNTLSGGQKQRVAIARALAQNPMILLCDEATSALDPETTDQILKLLKKINQELKITIVLITHEMGVVRKICDNVAILSEGRVVEAGSVLDIFSNPESKEAKNLIWFDNSKDYVKDSLSDKNNESKDKKYRVVYSGENEANEPVLAKLILKFGQQVNIYYADTKEVEGKARGQMIIGLPKEEKTAALMIDYLRDLGLKVWEVA